MNKDQCLDIGVVQAFIDGELASDLQENTIGHIALCNSCATLLAETEEESTFAFSILDEELNSLVPTERLRAKVFDSIKKSEEKVSWWEKVTGSLGFIEGFSFTNRSLVSCASLVLFVSALVIGVKFYNPVPSAIEVAGLGKKLANADSKDTPPVSSPKALEIYPPTIENDVRDKVVVLPVAEKQRVNNFRRVKTVIKTDNRSRKGESKPRLVTPQTPDVEPHIASPPSPNLQGEDSYLRAIATLNRTVSNNKDTSLRPSERIAFERDLAMVNDAIKKMKREVRNNPKNKAAREVLRSSYQHKIDLLNSVADKNELMASIQ